MIPDWDTDCLFVSALLEKEEHGLLAHLRTALIGVPLTLLAGTADIWCRDFMPVQLEENNFCQFTYKPDYLRGYEHRVTPPDKCRLPFMDDYRREEIVLDGGNVVASRTKVILTDKVYKENKSIERQRLRQRLEEVFQAECIFIPKEPYDIIGHADGVVRFVAEDRVLVNDYSKVDPGYGERLRSVLEKNGLAVETLPLFVEESDVRPDDIPSAVGIYINYLRVGDVVVVPGYGRSEDAVALEKVRQVLPQASVFQVPCRSLAEKGGVLNCISWTIKAGRLLQQRTGS